MIDDTIKIEDELIEDFIVYANEVNCGRAFPAAADGLKPVQRATLWEMFIKNYSSNKPHVKSAKVTGGTIATWHPHGDGSVYEALVRMSQPWVNNICEIDFHGANGSLLGGPDAASSRYTECRLAKSVEDGFFENIKKNTSEMILNFSEDEYWPKIFPAIFPRLFVNGSQGIGYTIAQEWEPGNLNEFFEKIKQYIETNDITYDNIYPDFPTGGIIINKSEIKKIYETGKGAVVLRGKTKINKKNINITELPYQTYAEPFIQKIKDLVNANVLTGIEDICNKSDDNGLNIEIECSEDPNIVLTKLFKLTELQTTFNANQMALVDEVPVLLNLKDYIKVYVDHNINCLIKEYTYEITKAKKRLEIVDGLIRAISIIDEIIKTIKASKSSDDAKTSLIDLYKFSESQAKAIVEMRLGKLANLEINELNKEQIELNKTINKCDKLLNSKKLQNKEFLARLNVFVDKYGWTRRTEVIDLDLDVEKNMLKKHQEKNVENYIVALTRGNTIKRMTLADANKKQKILTDEDIIVSTVEVSIKDRIVLISNTGTMYKLNVNKIDLCNINSTGMNLFELYNEKIIGIYLEETDLPYMIFVTKCGLIKKIKSELVLKLSKVIGAPVMKVNVDDEIIYSALVDDTETITLSNGKKEKEIKINELIDKGRGSGGIVGIKITKDRICSIIK